MSSNMVDVEKGLVTSTARSIPSTSPSSAVGTAISNNADTYTPLQLFQVLVGIHTPPGLTQNGTNVSNTNSARSKRLCGDNFGLYQAAQKEARISKNQYVSTSFISNTLYMLQIILAATFTALSAYKETKAVILTILGALNTIVAGSLAWQKGQGVPQRYRKAMDQYQALVHEIEKTERMFIDSENVPAGGEKLDARTEATRIEHLYDMARADQQANYPDLYVATNANASKDTKESTDLAKQLDEAKTDAAKVQSDLLAKIESLLVKLEEHTKGAVHEVAEKTEKTTKK